MAGAINAALARAMTTILFITQSSTLRLDAAVEALLGSTSSRSSA
jgi:hypothetical protein